MGQRWIVTEGRPPGDGTEQPEIVFKAGPSQVSGCGSTRVRFNALGGDETRVSVNTRGALNDKRAEAASLSLIEELRLDPKPFGLDPDAPPRPGTIERSTVRALVAITLAIAVLAFIAVPLPKNQDGETALPAVALAQPDLYRLEVALLVFYGGLLLLTPAFSGMIRGRLPTEISARGAKFVEEVDQSVAITQKAIKELERSTNDLADELDLANLGIEQLKQGKDRKGSS